MQRTLRLLGLLPLWACAQWEGTLVLQGRGPYTRADTLQGALNPYRRCYDVGFYHLQISLKPSKKSIAGTVRCDFRWLGGSDTLQIDLAEPLKLTSVEVDGKPMGFQRIRGTRAILVPLRGASASWQLGSLHTWRAVYEGVPRSAPRPPWDGGLVWSHTPEGQPWIGVACQGLGASLWWPLKDHLSDEPDSALLTFCVPPPLRVVANGRLITTEAQGKDTCFTYRVSHPINTYNITFYAAPGYVVYEDTFHSVSGKVIPMRFALLPANASQHTYLSSHSRRVLRALEHYLGPFPPQEDGFALVESPYYGMEHQSAIAYGNQFRTDPLWGFDYIILHETGHEWWGNHITASDNADLWIQEGFCTYMESLYLEYYHGYETAKRYLAQQRLYIQNRLTVQAPYGTNAHELNNDMYFKGAWILHTLRSRINNDSLWFACLRAIQDSFSFQTITAQELIAFMSRRLGEDLRPFFRAYLYYLRPPVVSYKVEQDGDKSYLVARWMSEEKEFQGPVEFLAGGQRLRYYLTQEKQRFPLPQGVRYVLVDRGRFMVTAAEEP